jgi:hypothetical protein
MELICIAHTHVTPRVRRERVDAGLVEEMQLDRPTRDVQVPVLLDRRTFQREAPSRS